MAIYAPLDAQGLVDNLLVLQPSQAAEFPGCVPVGDVAVSIGCRWQADGFYRGARRLQTPEEYWIDYARQVGEGLNALLDANGGGDDDQAVAAALWEAETEECIVWKWPGSCAGPFSFFCRHLPTKAR